jgi:hypothetical protein
MRCIAWEHHVPLAQAAGISDKALDGIKAGSGADLTEKQRAIWEYTLEMTRSVKVSEKTFAKLMQHCKDEREVVEITGTCAGYK